MSFTFPEEMSWRENETKTLSIYGAFTARRTQTWLWTPQRTLFFSFGLEIIFAMNSLNQQYEQKVRPCIDLIDSLRSLGVEKDLALPAIAVIGDQSSGKSSVLEALSGVALPRGSGENHQRIYSPFYFLPSKKMRVLRLNEMTNIPEIFFFFFLNCNQLFIILDAGIVTRCPLELKMKRGKEGAEWYGKISYQTHEEDIEDPADVEGKIREGLATGLHSHFTFPRFQEVIAQLSVLSSQS